MVKLIIVGDSMVGKTAFINLHLYSQFLTKNDNNLNKEYYNIIENNKKKDYKPTLDMEIHNIKFNNKYYEIWDFSGNIDVFNKKKQVYMKETDCAIIMFDYTNKDSIDNIICWFNEIKSNCGNEIPIVLCGNNYENNMESIRIPELHQYNISVKNRIGLEQPFEYFEDNLK